MKNKKRRSNATGRNTGEQYVSLPYNMLKSEAWRSLSGAALKIYLELHTRYHGGNNGKISLGYADAKKLLHMGSGAIQRAFECLQVRGFIQLVQEGKWYGRKAAEWRLTTKSYEGRPPSHEWRNWQKTKHDPNTEHNGTQYAPLQE